jgi:hypothetical protein
MVELLVWQAPTVVAYWQQQELQHAQGTSSRLLAPYMAVLQSSFARLFAQLCLALCDDEVVLRRLVDMEDITPMHHLPLLQAADAACTETAAAATPGSGRSLTAAAQTAHGASGCWRASALADGDSPARGAAEVPQQALLLAKHVCNMDESAAALHLGVRGPAQAAAAPGGAAAGAPISLRHVLISMALTQLDRHLPVDSAMTASRACQLLEASSSHTAHATRQHLNRMAELLAEQTPRVARFWLCVEMQRSQGSGSRLLASYRAPLHACFAGLFAAFCAALLLDDMLLSSILGAEPAGHAHRCSLLVAAAAAVAGSFAAGASTAGQPPLPQQPQLAAAQQLPPQQRHQEEQQATLTPDNTLALLGLRRGAYQLLFDYGVAGVHRSMTQLTRPVKDYSAADLRQDAMQGLQELSASLVAHAAYVAFGGGRVLRKHTAHETGVLLFQRRTVQDALQHLQHDLYQAPEACALAWARRRDGAPDTAAAGACVDAALELEVERLQRRLDALVEAIPEAALRALLTGADRAVIRNAAANEPRGPPPPAPSDPWRCALHAPGEPPMPAAGQAAASPTHGCAAHAVGMA